MMTDVDELILDDPVIGVLRGIHHDLRIHDHFQRILDRAREASNGIPETNPQPSVLDGQGVRPISVGGIGGSLPPDRVV